MRGCGKIQFPSSIACSCVLFVCFFLFFFFLACESISVRFQVSDPIRPPNKFCESCSLCYFRAAVSPWVPVSDPCHTPLLKPHQSRGHWEITQSFRLLWTSDRLSPWELPKILSSFRSFTLLLHKKKGRKWETKQEKGRSEASRTHNWRNDVWSWAKPTKHGPWKAGFLSIFRHERNYWEQGSKAKNALKDIHYDVFCVMLLANKPPETSVSSYETVLENTLAKPPLSPQPSSCRQANCSPLGPHENQDKSGCPCGED